MPRPGVEFTRSAEAHSLGELRGREISARTELEALAPGVQFTRSAAAPHSAIERSREFGAHRVAALARVGRAFCGGAIPTGRGLRWASAFEHLKTSNNSLQGCREFPLQHCALRHTGGLQFRCCERSRAKFGRGWSKSDATVRSGAFVAGAGRAGRRRGRRLLRASALEGAYAKRLCILAIGSWRRRFLCLSSARAAAPRNKVGRALSSHSARDDCSKRDDGRLLYPFIPF